MDNDIRLGNLGELYIIKFIEKLIFQKTGKKLLRDDSFFFSLRSYVKEKINENLTIIFNTDMLVSSTDVPPQMTFYQIGRKAVLMNISDIIVKGVLPRGMMISLGLPKNLKLNEFEELMDGILDFSSKWNVDYLGGDVNETKETIINPTVFGIQDKSKIIYRKGLTPGDLLVVNGKFGLTGVGLDILLNKKGEIKQFPKYKKSILSVLEPNDLGKEAFILLSENLARVSIDSSDGLAKSLKDLIDSNQDKKVGFEIDFNENLINEEAIKYSEEFNIPLEGLVFGGGEEFIHLFTLNPKDYDSARKLTTKNGGQILKIGRVISEKKVYYIKENKKIILKKYGYEHFK